MSGKRKNVVYSTTRQWNPGDEFILHGCQNILSNLIGEHNAIIYNRNPELKSGLLTKGLREQKYPDKFWEDAKFLAKEAYLKIGQMDNSIKFDSDLSSIDLAVFAGTPSWTGGALANFYEHIIKNNLPAIFLGLGSYCFDFLSDYEKEVVQKAKLITVRDKNFENKYYNAFFLPCPAMQCIKLGQEKKITKLKSIGLGFGVTYQNAVCANCINDKTYQYQIKLYCHLLEKYKGTYNFLIICTYIDELPLAQKIFKKYNIPVYYSYDAKDYEEIYRQADLVISHRVHGCGISSSLGIPSICISHDERGGTARGFLSEFITDNTPIEKVCQIIEMLSANICTKNQEIINHKKDTFNQYL